MIQITLQFLKRYGCSSIFIILMMGYLILAFPYVSDTKASLLETAIIHHTTHTPIYTIQKFVNTKNTSTFQSVKPKIKVYTHKGGKKISPQNLKATIKAVAMKLSTIPTNQYQLLELVYETAHIESNFGKYIYSSGGIGIMQITKNTAKWYLDTIKITNRVTYNELMTLYDKSKSLEDNLRYNVPFSIGMCMLIYWQRAKTEILSSNNIKDRARIWKKYYNTNDGGGSVKKYIARNS